MSAKESIAEWMEGVERRIAELEGRKAVIQRLLTVEQAAAYLGRSELAVRDLVKTQAFPVVRLDRRVQIDIRDLDTWITRHKAA